MGYRLNCRDEPVFMAVQKPVLTEFGIHYRLESYAYLRSLCDLFGRDDGILKCCFVFGIL